MMGQLITLPLRLTARAGSLMLRGTEAVLGRALALAGRAPGADAPAGTDATDTDARTRQGAGRDGSEREGGEREGAEPEGAERARRAEPSPQEPAPTSVAPEQPTIETPPPAIPETPEPVVEEPIHVSEEPEVVREEAEPGAEDGAGAQVTIDEPWEGYARLHAKDVIERLSGASQAELAAVTLYEHAHQARQTVLSAVERQLALTARDSTSN